MLNGVTNAARHISPFIFLSMLTGEHTMQMVAKVLLGLAALAFVMAVLCAFIGPIVTTPEAYSRAANNLALIAIAMFLGFKE